MSELSDQAAELADQAQDAVTDAADHPIVEKTARVGYGANAFMHLVIGLLAAKLALGSTASADQGGVLQALVDNPLGKVLLVVGGLAWLGLAFWQVGEACLSWMQTKTRLKAGAKAITYAVLSALCFLTLARGESASKRENNVTMTGKLLNNPAGRGLVLVVGAAIIGVGIYHCIKGIRKKFYEDLQEKPPVWVEYAGIVGYVLKGLALMLTGMFIANAALTNDANDAGGLDTALHKLLDKPFGSPMVMTIAIGFAIFAVYSLARSRYAKV